MTVLINTKVGSPARRKIILIVGSLFVATIVAVVAVCAMVPTIRWRAQLVFMMATGQIPDIGWGDLVDFMKPNSPQPIARLVETHTPYSIIRNPQTSPADVAAGGKLFQANCASCHQENGTSNGVAPALVNREFKYGESDWAIYRTIRDGVPGTAMASYPLPQDQLWQLIAFIRSLGAQDGPQEAKKLVIDKARVAVSYDELKAVREPAADWLTYSGSYWGTRHSKLTQITPDNVNQLAVRWIHGFADESGLMEVSPLVRNGVMYVAQRHGRVVAMEAATGKTLWDFDPKMPRDAIGGEKGAQNRGVAMLGDKIFVGTTDMHLIALSATTGKKIWDSVVRDYKEGYLITAAPLAYRDLVVTGHSTYPAGRGSITAYDAETGKERWRFWAIPGPGEPGNETWLGDSWKSGGGPTWMTGSYDPELDLLYWGIGAAKPDYNPMIRKGDNLYTASMVALRGSTGELVWHFQFTPAEEHDWDPAQIPILIDETIDGQPRKLLLLANRNGFYYVLDRETGKFLNGTPFVQQNWADRLDEKGRPVRHALPADTSKGVLVYPSNTGGTNWWPPTYDPANHLTIVPSLERGMIFFPGRNENDTKAQSYRWPTPTSTPFYTAVRALDALTGKLVWEYRRPSRLIDDDMGGTMSTDSGLVFGGDQNNFFALSAKDGKPLWNYDTGGKVHAAPVTYEVDGVQYVAIAAGHDLLSFGLLTNQVTARQ